MSGIRKALLAAAYNAGRTMTAETMNAEAVGFCTTAGGALFSPAVGAKGSMSDNTIDGDVIDMIASIESSPDNWFLFVIVEDTTYLDGVTIDGTYYTLSRDGVVGGLAYYIHTTLTASAHFTDGVTYDIEFTIGSPPATVTAEYDAGNDFVAFLEADLAALFGANASGSTNPTPLMTADGELVFVKISGDPDGGGIYIEGSAASLTNIEWDGTDYALTWINGAGGYDFYTFNCTTALVDATTYTCVIT